MKNKNKTEIKWLTTPEDHNYPAAGSYLRLVWLPTKAEKIVGLLRNARASEFKAKDIFRASGLSLLGVSNSHVAKNNKKIKKGVALSPILLVVSDTKGLIVADGYHRLCSVYHFDEDAVIPCKITYVTND